MEYRQVDVTDDLKTFFMSLSELDRARFSFLRTHDAEELADRERYYCLVAIDDKTIVGYAHLQFFSEPTKHHIVSLGIAVSPLVRGRGVASKLMKMLIEHAETRPNIKKIRLNVRDDNVRAIHLYERFGFRPEGAFLNEEFDDVFHTIISMGLFLHKNKNPRLEWLQPTVGTEEFVQLTKAFSIQRYSQGVLTQAFEQDVADYVDAKHVVAFNNATSALLACYTLAFPPSSVIAVPSYTFIGTTHALHAAGHHALFIDNDPKTGNIDYDSIKLAINDGIPVAGIVPVDIAGHPVDIPRLRQYNLPIVEDAAEALGAWAHGRPVGSQGHPTVFSFHIAKLASSIEGGAVATNDATFADKLRQFRNNGEKAKFVWESYGLNLRFNDILASIGRAQLRKLDDAIENRNKIVSYYKETLSDVVEFQHVEQYVTTHPYMLCLVKSAERDKLISRLSNNNIEYRVGWKPVHQQPAYTVQAKNLQNSEQWGREGLCLPLSNRMRIEDARRVAEALRSKSGCTSEYQW